MEKFWVLRLSIYLKQAGGRRKRRVKIATKIITRKTNKKFKEEETNISVKCHIVRISFKAGN